MATNIGLNKDWVVVISQNTADVSLTDLNTRSKQISLICKIVAPMAFSLLLTYFSLFVSLICCACLNIASALFEVLLLNHLIQTFPMLENKIPKQTKENTTTNCIEPYRQYFNQSCLLASLAYVTLFMSVLSPGALVTNYLVFKQMPPLQIAVFQGVASLLGFTGTLFTPSIIQFIGLNTTGKFLYQVVLFFSFHLLLILHCLKVLIGLTVLFHS